jgi:hypothetical protein
MKSFLSLMLLAGVALAQDVTDLANAKNAAARGSTNVLSITASQGDGTVCMVNKIAGSSVNAQLACTSADGKIRTSKSLTASSSSNLVQTTILSQGDVLCLIAVNPTGNAVSMGSLGSVPSVGLAWSCTTNMAAGGQTPIVSGSVTWP